MPKKTLQPMKLLFQTILLTCGALLLFGCAPSRDFQTTPQEGAWRTGTYPNFSVRPEAATAQLSKEQTDALTQKLETEGKEAHYLAYKNDRKYNSQESSPQKQANQDIEDTLKHITGSQ